MLELTCNEQLKIELGADYNEFVLYHLISITEVLHSSSFAILDSLRIVMRANEPGNARQIHEKVRTKICYGADFDGLMIDIEKCEKQLPDGDNEEFLEYYSKCLETVGYRDDTLPVAQQIKQVFQLNPGIRLIIAAVADELAYSVRSLQRKLTEEGGSYKEVLEAWLKERAIVCLQKDNISIEATASPLGYADEANFRRAFKRWYNCSVSEYMSARSKRQ